MSNTTTINRINMRLSADDIRRLRIVAADVQRRRGSPFVSPADAVRAALRITAEKIAADGLKEVAR